MFLEWFDNRDRKKGIYPCQLNKMDNLRFETYVSFNDLTEDYSPEISLSYSSAKLPKR